MEQDFEKLGVFYLGRQFDTASGKEQDDLILYDSRDLTTHGVCIGMTGSGKTGLCLALLEEAAIDGIPVIAIDPKGDLPNLLLTFPNLAPEEFRPWINEEEARRKGSEPDAYAQQQAKLWRDGLEKWGQGPERIQRLRDSAEFRIYTPGSTAGRPVSVLKSFAAPPPALLDDPEAFNERVAATVSGLLGLVGVEADPLASREHIVLSTILAARWREGADLDLPTLISLLQQPPFKQIGVMPIDSFFPPKERFALAMTFNNLLASPAFASWLEGEPLDLPSILHTQQGKPVVSIFSIAHLGDAERMFFVSLLLNQIIGWMRSQPGTTSLRALIYMDEVFGYLPPVANPPSKQSLLLLLKQARAFGVGLLLATQNPVDLDYKALSNAGTWFIGRLQTERDKARVLEALQGASATSGQQLDPKRIDAILSGLGNRVFLLHNTHEDAPVTFTTRWAMSYLCGPLTRQQIRQLTAGDRAAETATTTGAPAAGTAPAESGNRPVLPPEITQHFLPLDGARPADAHLFYRPALLGCAEIHFASTKYGVDTVNNILRAATLTDSAEVTWDSAATVAPAPEGFPTEPTEPGYFESPPAAATVAKNYAAWQKAFAAYLYRSQRLDLLRSPGTGQLSKAGENERDFRVRLTEKAREQRDALVEELRKKYAAKIAALEERVSRAKMSVDVQKEQDTRQKVSSMITIGTSILGAVLGRKSRGGIGIRTAQSAVRGVGGVLGQAGDVGRAKETLESREQALATLQQELQTEVDQLKARIDPQQETLEPVSLAPTKTNIAVTRFTLAWLPFWRSADGKFTPAWPTSA